MASLQAYQSHGIRYYRIVESFRKEGKPAIRVLAHLGRAEDILGRLSWDECRFLAASGIVEIGCHTYDLHAWHGNLSRADAIAAFNERLPQDLSAFQEVYASEMGRPARILAWPYGRYDGNSIMIAKRAGFHYILSSNHRYFEASDSRLDVPRFTIDTNAPLPLFRKIVERRP